VDLVNLTIPTILTKCTSPSLSDFKCTKRMLSQKEWVKGEVLAWRRAPFCKENNARKELLG